MKPSHIRTPRTLSECYFVEGYYSIEPSMWRGRWDSNTTFGVANSKSSSWKIVVPAVLAVIVIAAILVQPLI